MTFLKAAIAVYLACQAWDVKVPEICIHELIDCWDTETIEVCQEKILDKYEPRDGRITEYACR